MGPKRRSSASGKNRTLYLRKEVVQSSDLEKDWLKAGLAQRRVAPWRKASSSRKR